MKAWEDIVNKALLGSEKASLNPDDLPGEITRAYEVATTADKEDTFLKIASLAFQYRQGGARAMKANHIGNIEAAPESRAYCSGNANRILNTLLEEELVALINYWLGLCQMKQRLAQPEMVPALLGVAQRKKELRNLIMSVVGERGKWLCNLNPEWSFTSVDVDTEKAWAEGSAEDRRDLLRQLRNADPDRARKLVESSWSQEGANEKLSFLEILKTNISAADLAWLESLKEKGQKVNTAILELQKTIPASAVVQEYQKVLSEFVNLKTGKALLGMITKTEVFVNESYSFPDSIFKTGIDKLSSNKNVSDSSNIIAQLMMAVPPSFWVEHLKRSPQEIVELLQKDKQSAFYLPAIAIAAVQFKDRVWISTILEKTDKDLIESSVVTLLSGLSDDDRNKYALKYFDTQPAQIIQLLLLNTREWSVDLAKAILKFTAREVYQYNKVFYKQAVAFIPVAILDHLDSFTPTDEQRKPYWQTQRDELARLLTLKQQILQSFNT